MAYTVLFMAVRERVKRLSGGILVGESGNIYIYTVYINWYQALPLDWTVESFGKITTFGSLKLKNLLPKMVTCSTKKLEKKLCKNKFAQI